jgi:hypothetical protein
MWRVFSTTVIHGFLPAGRIFRWFALNLPMDLLTGSSEFTSDIDIVSRLRPYNGQWTYKTWEVKVSLICKDGSARSLKRGKVRDTVKQLKAYRAFGSPEVALLDVYVCESGYLSRHRFPPDEVVQAIRAKQDALVQFGFGYQILPIEYRDGGDMDVGLRLLRGTRNNMPFNPAFDSLPCTPGEVREPFTRFAKRIGDFFEAERYEPKHKCFRQIVFCRECRTLGLIHTRSRSSCPHCGVDLIVQS